MSIYATIEGIGGDGDPGTIGQPWRYLGSHVLPGESGPRGGTVGLALIPSHITRDGRDHGPDDGAPWPWLRLALDDCGNDPVVLLGPDQARYLAAQLTDWADSTAPTAPPEAAPRA